MTRTRRSGPRAASRPRAWLLSLAILCSVPAHALAQPAGGGVQAAQEQFKQGRDAFKVNDFERALTLFRKSQELYPATGTLLNLAICEARLGQLVAARRHFKEVVPQLIAGDPRLTLAKKELAALEPRVPHLRIELAPGAPEGAQVSLDAAPASLGVDVPADPGQHVVEVTAPGREPRRYEVKLAEGTNASLQVEPGTTLGVAAPPPPDEPPAGPMSSRRTLGFVIGGVGIAGLGVGAVTGILALGKKGDVEDACPDPDECTPAGVKLADSGRTLSIVSTVAFALGAAGAGVGAYLVLTGGDEPDDSASTARGLRRPGPTAKVSAGVLPGGGGLSVRGTF